MCSRWIAVAGILLSCGVLPAVAQETSREAAVAIARGGDAARGLALLQALHARGDTDAALLADLVRVAVWAGQDAVAVEILQQYSNIAWPADVLESGARAARNRGSYRQAAQWFDAALARDPGRRGAAAGAAMSLAEAGDGAQANARADALLAAGNVPVDILLAAAYVRLRSARPAEALALYQRARALQADSAEAQAGTRLALAELGAAQAALAQGGAQGEEQQRLQTDRVAQQIRWAEYQPENPADRLAEAREALAAAEANLASLPAANTVQRRRAQLDHVVALRLLERMQEAVDAAEALRRDGGELPVYVQVALADALLYLRRPREAAQLYEAALAAQPQQTDVEFSLMYAQLEAEDFGAARRTLDTAVAHNPPWTRAPGLAQPMAHDPRARADINVALLQSFGDDLAAAQTRLEALLAEAPARAELQRELGTVYLRRGWPRRALERYRIAQTLQRPGVALRLDLLAAQNRLGRFDQIETGLQELQAEAPTNVHVQRFREDWDALRGWQLDLSARRGQGDSAVFGNRERDTQASLMTPLIGDFWRITAEQRNQRADIPEGKVAYRRNGLGLRYSREEISARLAWFTPRDGYADRDSVEAGLDWRPDDHWRFGAQLATATPDAPLRGRYYGITGRLLGLSAGWQRDEIGDIRVYLHRLDLSDGNQRDSAGAALRQQLLTTPHFKLDLHAELGASRNSLQGVPYFNPSRDVIALGGLVADWMNWRHYENRFQQRLGLWFGSYWQQGYGSSPVLRLGYEHEWQFGPSWALRYGLGWFRQSYDGRRETRREIFLALHWGGLPW
jgi:biofilm PGA synthesis protein PgaA